MNYRSVEDMNQAILRNLHRIPDDVSCVAGIPRSGLLAANLIALYLNRPLTHFKGLDDRTLLGKGKRPMKHTADKAFDGRILVVDDCVSQGTEMKKAREHVKTIGLGDQCFFLSVFSFPEHPEAADLVLEMIPRPMAFQWSIMHTPELAHYCLDIDGLLCHDCPGDCDDDGDRYLDFLKTAKPLFIPTVEVGYLVTARLEKYRKETETWLAENGVQYRELIMMDHATKEAREAAGRTAEWKAEVYQRTGAKLFIESCPGMAERIEKASGKPAVSMVSDRMVGNPQYDRAAIAMGKLAYQARRVRRLPRKLGRSLGIVG